MPNCRFPAAAKARALALSIAFLFCAVPLAAQTGPASASSPGAAAGNSAPAPAWRFPRIEPDPEIERVIDGDTKLSPQQLITLSLYFSGMPEADLPTATAAFNREMARARRTVGEVGDASQRGEALLQYLHQNLLKRYYEYQTRIDVLFREGTFNCVSSAVVYLVFGRSLGLDVAGVKTTDHAFCTVRTASGLVDVETTNRYGFDPGSKKEFTDSFGKATGFSYVPPHQYGRRAAIGDRELVSLILSNRIAALERSNRFGDAVPFGVDRYALLGDPATKSFMIDRFLNYASSLNQGGRYAEGLAFVTAVRGRWGEPDRYTPVIRTLTNNIAVSLVRKGDYRGANAFLEDLRGKGDISDADYAKYHGMVADKLLFDQVQAAPFDEALAAVQAAYAGKEIGIDQYAGYIAALHLREAIVRNKAEGPLAAAAVVDAGLQIIPGEPRLVKARSAYRYNYAVGVHNQFAGLFNGKKFAEAKALVEGALEKVPDNRTLRDDLALVRRQLEE